MSFRNLFWSVLLVVSCILSLSALGQSPQDMLLQSGWQFRRADTGVWRPATVPGTIHTDLLSAGLIPDPYYRDNEARVQWVEDAEWEYQCKFSIPPALQKGDALFLQFDGLDTRADLYLNGTLILQADNMFRQWTLPVKGLIKTKDNTLRIRFLSASRIAKDRKAAEQTPYPDNERIYVSKAQYQFGWDWGPRMVTAGIWRGVRLTTKPSPTLPAPTYIPVKLVTKDDAVGQSFYFTRDGKPVYIKGANWIPLDNFIPRAVKQKRYEQIICEAKEAGINMLRVWGGGIYEEDIFYDLCDRYGIMVWQDFMFAGALYPGDSAFLKNVTAEIRYQVGRLRHHPCIALWCGNNEIDEAWHNWGWQEAFHYTREDSARLWSDYQQLFHRLIPNILQELDPRRPYWPSSPSTGWGREDAYRRGDVHYWGVWWGREPASAYKQKVGRFNSEYGMQAFPNMATIKAFSTPADWDTASSVMKAHEKHPFGYANIGMYVAQRFKTPHTFEDIVYVSGLMQADAIGTAITAHRSAKPYNMGTMYWQLNDCWPVVSWSSIDYYGRKKPLHYRLRELYAAVLIAGDTSNGRLKITVSSDTDFTQPLRLLASAHYLDGKSTVLQDTMLTLSVHSDSARHYFCSIPDVIKQQASEVYYSLQLLNANAVVASSICFLTAPKDLHLTSPKITWNIKGNVLRMRSAAFAYGVHIEAPAGITPDDNYFHLVPGVEKTVRLKHNAARSIPKDSIKVHSLWDTYRNDQRTK